MTHTDIKKNGWVLDKIPEGVRPYWYLMRLDRPIGTWLLLLPGLWAIMLAAGGALSLNIDDIILLALFCIGAVIMRGAGCVINDLWDRELDKKVARTASRPIAAGDVSVRQALCFLGGLLLAGLVILFQMHIVTILLGFLVFPLVITYPLMKRVTWWPQLFLGLTFNFGALMGWAAVTGVVGLPALLLYIGGIFWTLGYDTIYADQDKEDDALIGIKSSILKLGDDAHKTVRIFYAIAFFLYALAFVLAGAGYISLAVLVLGAVHFKWQLKTWQREDITSALRVFRSNRDFGLILLLAAAL